MRILVCVCLVAFGPNLFAQGRMAGRATDPSGAARQVLLDYPPTLEWAAGANAPQPPPGGTVSVNELSIPAAALRELQQYQRNFESGNIPDSVKHLEKAIKIYSHMPAAHQDLGVCYARLHEYDKAVAEFQSAATLDGHIVQPEISLAGVYFLQARYPASEAATRRALAIDASNAGARYLLGRALAAQGQDAPETRELLRESAAQYPVAHLILANLLLQKDAKDAALAEFREYLKQPGAPQKDKVACTVERLSGATASAACITN